MKATELQREIFRDIVIERRRQDAIHGESSIIERNPLGFENFAILGEEVGEVGKALLDSNFSKFPVTSREELGRELVQVAAVAVAWLEKLMENPQ